MSPESPPTANSPCSLDVDVTQSDSTPETSSSASLSVSQIVQRALTRSSSFPALLTSSTQPPPARPSRGTRTRRTPAASKKPQEVDTRPVRRQRLQVEKMKHQKLFDNGAEVMSCASGLAGKKYKCKRCSVVKRTEITMKQHLANCGKPFKGKRRKKNDRNKYTCNQCIFKAGTLADLAIHRRREHLGALKRPGHKCTTCKKVFKKARYLQVHLKKHRGAAVFTCPTCSINCSTKYNLERHLAVHHPGERVEVVQSQADELAADRAGGSGKVAQSRWSKYKSANLESRSSDDEDEEGGEDGVYRQLVSLKLTTSSSNLQLHR